MKSAFVFSSLFLLFQGIFLFGVHFHTTHAGFDLGSAAPGAKVFHVDNTRRSRAAASTYCSSQTPAKTLATIDETTNLEYTFLDSKYATNFSGWYWTAARVKTQVADFEWFPQAAPVDPLAFGTRMDMAASGLCVAFYSKPGLKGSHGIIKPCDATDGFALCEPL